MVKFSTDLWDGFDHLTNKTEQGLVVFKDVTEFLKKRVTLEAEYAKKLQELCKSVPGAGMFSKSAPIEKESKTLKGAFLSWNEEGSKIAQHHLDFATKVNMDIVKPLENFVKTKEVERKKAVMEGQKRVKAYQDTKANHDKAKDVYLKSMKEAEQATEAHEKAKTEAENAPEAKKKQAGENEKRAGQKATQLTEKGKAAEAAYQKAVDTLNDLSKETYTTHIPPVLDSLQQLEEERYGLAKQIVETFHKEFKTIPTSLAERADTLEQAMNALDMDLDFAEFIQEKKGPNSEPEVFRFVAYKEPATTTTSTPSAADSETVL